MEIVVTQQEICLNKSFKRKCTISTGIPNLGVWCKIWSNWTCVVGVGQKNPTPNVVRNPTLPKNLRLRNPVFVKYLYKFLNLNHTPGTAKMFFTLVCTRSIKSCMAAWKGLHVADCQSMLLTLCDLDHKTSIRTIFLVLITVIQLLSLSNQ